MAYECGATFKIKDEVSSNLGSIKSSISSVKSTLGDLNSTSSNTNSKLGILKNGFLKAGNGADSGGSGIKGFNNNCNNTNGITNLTSKLKSLAIQYLGIKSAVNFAKSALTGGMEFENMRNTLNVVMKDSKLAGEKFREAVEFANATPFDTKEIIGGFVKLESYGVKTTKEMTTAVGDMAGVMGKSFDQAVEAVADAQTGELERLKEFGITKQQLIDHGAKIMADKELVNNKGQIVNQEAFNQTLLSLMQERFKGGIELQSKTLSGSISTMKGVIGNTMAQLAGVTEDGMVKSGGAVDILKGKVLRVTEVIQKWATDGGLKKVTDGMQEGFRKAGQAVQFLKQHADVIIPALKTVVSGFIAFKTVNTVTKGINNTVNAFKNVKNAMSGTKTAMGGIKAAMSVLSPTKIILMGIALVAVLVIKNWDKLSATFKKVGDNIAKYTGVSGKHIKEFMKIFGTVVKKSIDSISKSFKSLAGKILPPLKEIIKIIANSIKELMPILQPVLAFIAVVFVTGICGAFSIMGTVISAAIDVIGGVIGGLLEVFKGVLNFIIGVFTGNWKQAWEGVKQILSGVIDILKSLWRGLVDLLTAPVQALVDILDSVFHEKVAVIKNAWDNLRTFMLNPIQATVSLVKNGDLSGVNAGGKIPGHKTGLTRVPFDGYRAELHEGERVLTKRETDLLDQGKLGGNIGNAPTINLNIANMNVREEADINKIAKALADMVRIDALNYAH